MKKSYDYLLTYLLIMILILMIQTRRIPNIDIEDVLFLEKRL